MTRSSARLQQKGAEASKKTSSKKSTSSKPTATKAKVTNTRKKQKVQDSNNDASKSKAAASKPNPAWSKVRGKRGQLQMVVEMPFDILLEIFKYLLPADLLSLTFANKALRGLLLDRTVALPLWKMAFDSVEPAPPLCPEGLILPQYANLLYGRTCFYCDAIHGLKTSWVCYLRFCKGCLQKEFCPTTGFGVDTRNLRTITPSHYERLDGIYSYMHPREDYERNKKELARLADAPVQLKAFIEKEEKNLAARHRTAWTFRNWEWAVSKAKKEDVEARRNNRLEALKNRLTDLGYGNDLARLPRYGLETLPGFKGVKPLTEREWEKLKPDLVDICEELRKQFEKKDRVNCLNRRIGLVYGVHRYFISNNRDLELTGPTHRELAMMEPFKALVLDAPREQQLTQADMLVHLDKLPQIFKDWNEASVNVLLDLLPQDSEGGKNSSRRGKTKSKTKDKAPALDPAVLDLATTVFSCKWCPEILVYPNVLFHSCLLSRHKKEGKESESEDEDDTNCPWNEGHDQVEFDAVSSACISVVVTALGKDPKTTTWKELDEANQRVECLSCCKDSGKVRRLAMDWRHAILHAYEVHSEEEGFEKNQTRWRILDSESLARAYDKEANWRNPTSWRDRFIVEPLCSQCNRCTIVNDRVEYAYGRALGNNRTTCPKGHDLTQEGGIYYRYPGQFNATPNPVRIL